MNWSRNTTWDHKIIRLKIFYCSGVVIKFLFSLSSRTIIRDFATNSFTPPSVWTLILIGPTNNCKTLR